MLRYNLLRCAALRYSAPVRAAGTRYNVGLASVTFPYADPTLYILYSP